MNEPRSHYVTVLDRELHYMEWGERGKPPLVMWHGLARTGRDFDDIARALSAERHIVVPDTIGRGLSQWSPAPEREYCYDFYTRSRPRCSTRCIRPRSIGSARRWAAPSPSAPGGAAQGAHPPAGAQRHRPRGRARGARSHPFLCRQAAAVRSRHRTRGLFQADLQALRSSHRCAMAPSDGKFRAPPAGRRHHHALRSEDGAAVRTAPER